MDKNRTVSETITVTRQVRLPDPLDCPFIGAVGFNSNGPLSRDNPFIVYDARWGMPEVGDQPEQSLIIMFDDVELRGGARVMGIRANAERHVLIEPGTDSARSIFTHVLYTAARELGLIDDGKYTLEEAGHSDPLIGVPCYRKGEFALPFATFDQMCKPDISLGEIEPQKKRLIAFFQCVPKPSWDDTPVEQKVRLEVNVLLTDRASLMPLMQGTANTRRHFRDIMNVIDRKLAVKRIPRTQTMLAAPTPAAAA